MNSKINFTKLTNNCVHDGDCISRKVNASIFIFGWTLVTNNPIHHLSMTKELDIQIFYDFNAIW